MVKDRHPAPPRRPLPFAVIVLLFCILREMVRQGHFPRCSVLIRVTQVFVFHADYAVPQSELTVKYGKPES